MDITDDPQTICWRAGGVVSVITFLEMGFTAAAGNVIIRKLGGSLLIVITVVAKIVRVKVQCSSSEAHFKANHICLKWKKEIFRRLQSL